MGMHLKKQGVLVILHCLVRRVLCSSHQGVLRLTWGTKQASSSSCSMAESGVVQWPLTKPIELVVEQLFLCFFVPGNQLVI